MSAKLKRTIRTALQSALGLAAGLPLIADASGLTKSAGVATVLVVAAAATRVMALPVVENFLNVFGIGFVAPAPAPAAPTPTTPQV